MKEKCYRIEKYIMRSGISSCEGWLDSEERNTIDPKKTEKQRFGVDESTADLSECFLHFGSFQSNLHNCCSKN